MRLIYKRGDVPTRTRVFEGLLILGILGVLAAILLPVYTGRPYSTRSNCLSNVKQLWTAVMIYSSDNNDVCPPYFTFDGPVKTQQFIDATLPYLKNAQMYLCLSDNDSKKSDSEGLPGKMSYIHSLFLKGVIPDFNKGSRVLVPALISSADQAKTPYLRDPIRGFGTSLGKFGSPDVTGFLSPHGGGFNVGFIDGHAKFKRPIDEFTEL